MTHPAHSSHPRQSHGHDTPQLPRRDALSDAEQALTKVASWLLPARGGSIHRAVTEGASVCLCCMDERVAPERNIMGHNADLIALRDPGAGLLRVAMGQVSFEDFIRQMQSQRVGFVCSHTRCGASDLVTGMLLRGENEVADQLGPILGPVGLGLLRSHGKSEPDLLGELFARRTAERLGAAYWNLSVNSREHYSHNVYIDLAGKTAGRFRDTHANAGRNGFFVTHPRYFGFKDERASLDILAAEAMIASRIIHNQATDRSKSGVQIGIIADDTVMSNALILQQKILDGPDAKTQRVEILEISVDSQR